MAGAGLYLVIVIVRHFRRHGSGELRTAWRQQISKLKKMSLIGYAVILLVAGGLFLQRYGVNAVRYHNPIPDCGQVLTVAECEQYAPWGRDYRWSADNEGHPRDSVLTYSNTWIKHLMRELFFAVYAAFIGNSTIVGYWGEDPIPTLKVTAWVILITGAILSCFYARRLWRFDSLRLLFIVSLVYTLALFYQNYKMYLHVNVAVAIHGRYVLPVIPFFLVWFLLAARELLRDAARFWPAIRQRTGVIQLAVFAILMLLTLQGGGISTHLVRGDDKWYWQYREPAIRANRHVQSALKALIFE
jgi:hypothetical protein